MIMMMIMEEEMIEDRMERVVCDFPLGTRER